MDEFDIDTFYSRFIEEYTRLLSRVEFTEENYKRLPFNETDKESIKKLLNDNTKNINLKIRIYLYNIASLIKLGDNPDNLNDDIFSWKIPTAEDNINTDEILKKFISDIIEKSKTRITDIDEKEKNIHLLYSHGAVRLEGEKPVFKTVPDNIILCYQVPITYYGVCSNISGDLFDEFKKLKTSDNDIFKYPFHYFKENPYTDCFERSQIFYPGQYYSDMNLSPETNVSSINFEMGGHHIIGKDGYNPPEEPFKQQEFLLSSYLTNKDNFPNDKLHIVFVSGCRNSQYLYTYTSFQFIYKYEHFIRLLNQEIELLLDKSLPEKYTLCKNEGCKCGTEPIFKSKLPTSKMSNILNNKPGILINDFGEPNKKDRKIFQWLLFYREDKIKRYLSAKKKELNDDEYKQFLNKLLLDFINYLYKFWKHINPDIDFRSLKLLLQKGADVNAKNKDDGTPLHKAIILENIEIIKLLLEKGAKINILDKNGVSALYIAVYNNNKDIVELLLQYGADVNALNIYDISPLYIAIYNENKDMVELLLKNNDDINAKDNNGQTPLHIAVYKNNSNIVKLLLQNDADVNAKNKDDISPLDLAIEKGNKDIVKLLQKYNIQKNSIKSGGFKKTNKRRNKKLSSRIKKTNKTRNKTNKPNTRKKVNRKRSMRKPKK